MNCYPGRGATDLDPPLSEVVDSVEECQSLCIARRGCSAVVTTNIHQADCFGRASVDIGKCNPRSSWSTYVLTEAPPSSPPATPFPFWIPSVVEQTTYYDLQCVASHHNLVGSFLMGMDLHMVGDDYAQSFIETHFTSAAPTWDLLGGGSGRHGAHRADLCE